MGEITGGSQLDIEVEVIIHSAFYSVRDEQLSVHIDEGVYYFEDSLLVEL